ncbi:MAG: PilZ domain-containing protein [Thermodesulfovibrionales bacterium]|nr:PilZ domain-containing protein [Thermodesulfovibrionales bacterium]
MSFTHKILVVESSREQRNFIKFGIERSFANVDIDEAGDFVDALTKIDQKFYDLVILNIVDPDIKGTEIIKTLKDNQSSKNSYILAMAYRDSKEEIVSALKTGANSYILIPFSINDLVLRLREIDERFDRRQHERYVTDIDVVLSFEDTEVSCELIDMSLGGVLLDINRYKNAPNVLDKVFISINEKSSSIVLDAIVIRIQAIDTNLQSQRVRYALKFLPMDEDKRDALKRVVDSL